MHVALFLIILNLFKLWLGRFLPLLGDEAYYSLWSQHLALSYNDHPPMIAYLHWLAIFLFGQNDFGVRFTAIICLLIASGFVYLIAKEIFDKKIAALSIILFNLIPTYLLGGFFLTPEQPLLIFWLASTYFAVKIFKTQNRFFWYPFGVCLGLGLMSKYPMALFIPGFILFLLISRENRHWFFKKEPYFAGSLALLIFLPVIIWNFQYGFSSVLYHGGRLHSPHYFDNVLTYLGLQCLMFSPPVFWFTFRVFLLDWLWFALRRGTRAEMLWSQFSGHFLLVLVLPAFWIFLLVSPFTTLGGHWTSMLYATLVPLMASWLNYLPGGNNCAGTSSYRVAEPLRLCGTVATPNPPQAGKRGSYAREMIFSWGSILLINVLAIIYYAFLFPIPAAVKNTAYVLNGQLPAYIRQAKVDYVFSNQMGVGSLVAFYGKTPIYLPKGYWKQFDIWGQPQLKKGDNVLFFVFDDTTLLEKLKKSFKSYTIDTQPRLFVKDSGITERTVVFLGRAFIL